MGGSLPGMLHAVSYPVYRYVPALMLTSVSMLTSMTLANE